MATDPAPSRDEHPAFQNVIAMEAFAEFLSEEPDGSRADFERFCAEQPELAAHIDDLRELFARYALMRGESQTQPGDATLLAVARVLASSAETGAPEPPSEEVARRLRAVEENASPRERWQYLERVGEGGMGFVDRVWDANLGREVARKTVSLPEGSNRQRRLRLFLEEVRALSELDHPAVVPVHEAGLDAEGRLFVVMKHVDGQDLDEVIAQLHAGAGNGADRWTLTRVLGHLVTVAQALAYAHSKCVLHRDVKPANIRLGRYGETYLMDWGLARALGDEIDTAESDAELQRWAGTPAYMAPERLRGDSTDDDPRTDVYSLGAVLYHVLTGHAPFHDLPRDIQLDELRALMSSQRPTSVLDRTPEAPRELVELCERCLSDSPGERPQSAEAFANSLQEYLADVSEDRVEARRQTARAQRTFDFLVEILGEANPDRAQGRELTVREVLERAAHDALAALEQEPEDTAPLIVTLTEILSALDRSAAAKPLVERAIQLLSKRYAREDPIILRLRCKQAEVLMGLGRGDEAEQAYRGVLTDCQRTLGPDHELALDALTGMCFLIRRDHGRLDEAAKLGLEAWERLSRVYGDEHALSLQSAISLVAILRDAGRNDEAGEILHVSVERLVRHCGRLHRSTLLGMTELANHYDVMGQLERARDLFEQCAADYATVVGEKSLSHCVAMANGAWIDHRLGDHAKAEDLLRRALAGLEGSRGVSAFDSLIVSQNLALVLLARGETEEAVERMRRVVVDAAVTPHRIDGLLGRLRTNLGRVLLRHGDFEEAREVLADCAQELNKLMGAQHPWTVEAIELLGDAEAA